MHTIEETKKEDRFCLEALYLLNELGKITQIYRGFEAELDDGIYREAWDQGEVRDHRKEAIAAYDIAWKLEDALEDSPWMEVVKGIRYLCAQAMTMECQDFLRGLKDMRKRTNTST